MKDEENEGRARGSSEKRLFAQDKFKVTRARMGLALRLLIQDSPCL